MEKHTLVLPFSPNIVSLFMSWLIATKGEIREMLEVSDAMKYKFIPAGPLRKEDWPGESALDAKSLSEKGYLFLDCGGGEYDRKSSSEGSASSFDLFDHDIGLMVMEPHLMPLADIIRSHEEQAKITKIALAHRRGSSSTPSTPRHLMNMVQGWNLRYGDTNVVVKLAHTAFSGIERLINEQTDGLVGLSAEDQVREVRKMFLYDRLLEGALKHIETDAAGEQFRTEAANALHLFEEEWNVAVKDYLDDSTEFHEVDVGGNKLTVVVGTSVSERYMQVARFGNDGPPDRRPHDTKHRKKADVIIQFNHKADRFHIGTRGEVYLDEVAKLLREADLKHKGVIITPEIRAQLGQVGNLFVKDQRGWDIETLYFPPFRKSLGSSRLSNPGSAICLVPKKETIALTKKALAAKK